MAKPSLPQGTRDFGPDVVRKRNYILDTIKNVFELYGFQPLETPAIENIETLMGKYGEEGDKLIFRILNSGDIIRNIDVNEMTEEIFQFLLNEGIIKANGQEIIFQDEVLSKEDPSKKVKHLTRQFIKETVLSEKALKYDLTIPFARYVAMNHNQLTFPFKRYQIQPVWRGDRPQKGRYREFYQCDADVVGSNSLLNEIELILIIDKVYTDLSNYFSDKDENHVTININNRKIWAGIAELCSCPEKITEITVALDKYDKIGLDGVKKELIKKGFNEEQTHTIFSCLFPDSTFYTPYDDEYLNELNLAKEEKNLVITLYGYNKELYAIITCLLWNFNEHNIEIGISGVKEIMKIISPFYMEIDNFRLISSFINIDSTLARGLNYYTGTIIEIKAPSPVQIGSIGGGGRYDDLTSLFGVPNIPGVGISFGVDRIYDVMEELNLFPANVHIGTQVLFFNLGEKESEAAFKLMQELRNKGIRCELYHEQAKFGKQFKYAEKKNIPYVIIIGSKELEEKNCVVKNLNSGEQQNISTDQLQSFQFM
jgi:histidyl-tRNA synthetase